MRIRLFAASPFHHVMVFFTIADGDARHASREFRSGSSLTGTVIHRYYTVYKVDAPITTLRMQQRFCCVGELFLAAPSPCQIGTARCSCYMELSSGMTRGTQIKYHTSARPPALNAANNKIRLCHHPLQHWSTGKPSRTGSL